MFSLKLALRKCDKRYPGPSTRLHCFSFHSKHLQDNECELNGTTTSDKPYSSLIMLTQTVIHIDWDQHGLSLAYSLERMRFVYRALAKVLSDKLRRTPAKQPRNVYYLKCQRSTIDVKEGCVPVIPNETFYRTKKNNDVILFYFHVAKYLSYQTTDKP